MKTNELLCETNSLLTQILGELQKINAQKPPEHFDPVKGVPGALGNLDEVNKLGNSTGAGGELKPLDIVLRNGVPIEKAIEEAKLRPHRGI